MTKQKALAEYLGCELDDVEEAGYRFEADGCEYEVLTNEEADERTTEYIKESVWAFNKSFLNCHSDAISEIDDDAYAKLQEGCESINSAVLAMIDDFDSFVEDAVSADGRGHFLSGYDGEENEQGEYYIYRTN